MRAPHRARETRAREKSFCQRFLSAHCISGGADATRPPCLRRPPVMPAAGLGSAHRQRRSCRRQEGLSTRTHRAACSSHKRRAACCLSLRVRNTGRRRTRIPYREHITATVVRYCPRHKSSGRLQKSSRRACSVQRRRAPCAVAAISLLHRTQLSFSTVYTRFKIALSLWVVSG